MLSSLLNGFLLGWSVAWPPGPINAEMLRRGLERGFLPAWAVGLGACSGDFLWALAVTLGAGALMNLPGVRPALGALSVALLLFLAWTFGRGAWRAWLNNRGQPGETISAPVVSRCFDSARGGYLLGLTMALTSPWNIAFWLAVIGSQSASAAHSLPPGAALLIPVAVILGAATWGLIFCAAIHYGARFATPAWQIVTQAGTAALMLWFAARAAWRLAGGA